MGFCDYKVLPLLKIWLHLLLSQEMPDSEILGKVNNFIEKKGIFL
jgi:hypothetical protein